MAQTRKNRSRVVVIAGLVMVLLAIAGCAIAMLWNRAQSGAGPQEFYTLDPTSKPTPEDLAGIWTGTVVSPNGDSRREYTIRFIDSTHMVWEHVAIGNASTAAEFRSQIVLKGTYEINGGELKFQVLARAHGVEPLPMKAEDTVPRVYEWTRTDGEFHLRPKPSEPGFNWHDVTFRRQVK